MSDPKGKRGGRISDPALAETAPGRRKTLPMGSKIEDLTRAPTAPPAAPAAPPTDDPARAATLPPDQAAPNVTTSGTRTAREPATFPPNAWDRKENLVTSAKTSTVPPSENAAGSVSLSGERLGEELAREILLRAFGRAGLAIEPDYQFHHGNTLVVLDGFDPSARIGYQYISHADADVVTDHDTATEIALKELAAAGEARILVVHDVDAETGDDLLGRVEEFLIGLDITLPRG
jgi:hypothetical protein